MSEFSRWTSKFAAAEERYYRPRTKAVTSAWRAAYGVGGLAASVVMGNPVSFLAVSGTILRAGKGILQALKETKKVPFDDLAKAAGVSSGGFWTDMGKDVARGRSDTSLIGYHSGANEALCRAQYDDDEPPRLVETAGWSDDKLAGYERVIQIGKDHGPSEALDFVSGLRGELEGRSFSPTVVAPPRPAVGGVVSGAAGSSRAGVADLRQSLQALLLQTQPVLGSLATAQDATDELRGRAVSELETSASGRDVLEMLNAASAAVDDALHAVGMAISRTETFMANLSK